MRSGFGTHIFFVNCNIYLEELVPKMTLLGTLDWFVELRVCFVVGLNSIGFSFCIFSLVLALVVAYHCLGFNERLP